MSDDLSQAAVDAGADAIQGKYHYAFRQRAEGVARAVLLAASEVIDCPHNGPGTRCEWCGGTGRLRIIQ